MKWLGRIFIGLAVLAVAGCALLYEPSIPRAELTARYANADSKFITLPDGAAVHYRDQGPRDAPVLLLLHGSNASLHTWEPWVKDLSGDYRIVSVDLPGHGLTGAVPNGDYTQEGMSAFLKVFVDALRLDHFAIAGNSMGGGVAARFVIDNPGKATRLILIDAAGFPFKGTSDPGLGFRIARMPVVQNSLKYISPRYIFEQSLKLAFADPKFATPEMVDRYWLLNRMEGSREATLARFQEPFDETIEKRAGEIKIPTLILWGKEDRLIPVAAADDWTHAIPAAKLIVYPDVGHIVMEEAADRSAADVAVFLKATGG